MNKVSKLAILAASALAAGGTFGVAHAQQQPTVSEIVVTGSRIRTSPLEQTQPVVQIDEAQVAKTGVGMYVPPAARKSEQADAKDSPKATASLPKLVAFREWLLTQASDDTRHLEGLAGPQPGQRRNAGRQPTRKQNARQSSANAKS